MENNGESLPTMTLWEKIKDFFFNGDTQKCLFILNELCHPPADITKRDIKIYFEQLQGMANCGDRLHFTQVNDLKFTLTDKDFKPVLSLNLQKACYTVQADYQEDADYAYEKTFPFHTPPHLTETTPQAGDKDKAHALLRQPEGESVTATQPPAHRLRVTPRRTTPLTPETPLEPMPNPLLCSVNPREALIALNVRGYPDVQCEGEVPQTVEVFQATRIQRLPDHFPPALATLGIIDSPQLADNALDNLAARTPHLADLSLKGCDIHLSLKGCDMPRLPQQLPKTLTHVSLSQHAPMSPASLDNLQEHLPALTSLALTGDGFTQWPRGLPPSLHTLRVSAKLIQHASTEDFARLPDLSLLIITPNPSHPLPTWLKQLSPDITLLT
ncbi:hypothetical protein [Sodalis praecaptivus]|nr:hypothetical protein [Sodalis praecaptivus]